MADLSVTELAEALPEVTNGAAPPFRSGRMNENARKLAHEQGWVEPKAYKYGTEPTPDKSTTNGSGHANGENNEDGENVDNGTHPLPSIHQPNWAHDAGRYEWKEEFGDVGPRSEKLEDELFNGKYINRAGEKFKK
jgi:ATP-dependent RNA helicase DDX3X